jgi:hypothetical protein
MKKYFFLVSFALYMASTLYSQKNEFFEIAVENEAVTITGFTGKERNVVIPETIDSLPVRAIGIFVFNNLTGVTLPEGLASIGIGAFANNRLTSVAIPESVVSIGPAAFEGNVLRELVLPPRLAYIDQMAFAYNQLEHVAIPDGVTFIADGAFLDNRLTGIAIPPGVTVIGNEAFGGNPLVKITIGAGVEFYEAVLPFEESFCGAYWKNSKKAGTYIKTGETWEFEGDE